MRRPQSIQQIGKPFWDHIPKCQKRMKEDKWPWLQEKAALSNGEGCAWSIVSDQQIPLKFTDMHACVHMRVRTHMWGGVGVQGERGRHKSTKN